MASVAKPFMRSSSKMITPDLPAGGMGPNESNSSDCFPAPEFLITRPVLAFPNIAVGRFNVAGR